MKTGKPDGKLDDADKVIYGSADPGYLFGFNNTLRWKNFDLNVYFYGQFDKLSAGSYKKQWLSNNVNDAVVIISLLQYRIFGPPAIRTVRYPDISRLKVPMGSVTIIMKRLGSSVVVTLL
jgi:hypothetical protein